MKFSNPYIICRICNKQAERTGKRQKVCASCRPEETKRYTRVKSYELSVAKGHIKQPGVGTGNGQGSGPSHHTWTTGSGGYRGWRKDKCERCNSTEFLCAHHKDRNRKNNVEENIETLCKSCHQKEHEVWRNFKRSL